MSPSPFPPPSSLLSLLLSQSFSFGDEIAVGGWGGERGFTEILEASRDIARQLVYRFGVTPLASSSSSSHPSSSHPSHYVLLACSGSSSLELAAVGACLLLGVPFVPVDPAGPRADPKRLAGVVSALKTSALKTSALKTSALPSPRVVAIALSDSDSSPNVLALASAGVHNVVTLSSSLTLTSPIGTPDDLPPPPPLPVKGSLSDRLYVLFTSGTTSSPKAVIGSHLSTLSRVLWQASRFPASRSVPAVVARRADLLHVDGVTELLSSTLLPNFSLHQLPQLELESLGPAAVLGHGNVTRITVMPEQLEQILLALPTTDDDTLSPSSTSTLTHITLSGALCPPSLLTSPHFLPPNGFFRNVTLLNFYGQTETGGDCCFAVLRGPSSVPHSVCPLSNSVAVGNPLPDNSLSLSPAGEITVTGDSVAVSYLNGPPFEGVFATGDLATRSGGNGCLYVLGRIGGAGKVNGIATEPAAVVEAFLACCGESVEGGIEGGIEGGRAAAVRAAAVIVEGAAHLFLASPSSLPSSYRSSYRSEMRKRGTAFHLIPKAVTVLEEWPTGVGGKVDTSRLRELAVSSSSTPSVRVTPSPLSATVATVESLISSLISTSLSLPSSSSLSLSSSYVDQGGDSVRAVTLVHLLRREGMGEGVEVRVILEAKTVGELVEALRGGGGGGGGGEGEQVEETQKAKRAKLQAPPARPLLPFTPTVTATSVSFLACVDSPPAVSGSTVYCACQGGSVAKITVTQPVTHPGRRLTVRATTRLDEGDRVEGGIVLHEGRALVPAYNSVEETGTLYALSDTDLQVVWKTQPFKGTAKSSPLLVCGGGLAVLSTSAGTVVGVDARTGAVKWTVEVGGKGHGSPARVRGSLKSCEKGELQLLKRELVVVFSCDWEGGAAVVDCSNGTLVELLPIEAPVYAQPAAVEGGGGEVEVVVVDFYGAGWKVRVEAGGTPVLEQLWEPETWQPVFSGPAVRAGTGGGEGRAPAVAWGSHEGKLRVRSLGGGSGGAAVQEAAAGAAVLASPLWLEGGHVLAAATTAGTVLFFDGDTLANKGSAQLEGEVFCSPRAVTAGGEEAVVVGCRDSRLHFIWRTLEEAERVPRT